MATAPPPPPPPPCPPLGDSPAKIKPPVPGHAALPINDYPPVQETSPPTEALYEDAPSVPSVPLQILPLEENDLGDSPSDCEEKCGPVQETNPAPQTMTEQQDEADIQPEVAHQP